MRIDAEARHTAFRRLATHEAACGNSLMGVATRFEADTRADEMEADGGDALAVALSVVAACATGFESEW
jgi:hypothetical protein